MSWTHCVSPRSPPNSGQVSACESLFIGVGWGAAVRPGPARLEELQVDFKDGLEEAVIGAVVPANVALKEVDDQDGRRRQREERALALHILSLRNREWMESTAG